MNGFNFEWVEKSKGITAEINEAFPVNVSVVKHTKGGAKKEILRVTFSRDEFNLRFRRAKSLRIGFALNNTIMGFFPEDNLAGYSVSNKTTNTVSIYVPVCKLPKDFNPYRICNNYKLYVDDSGIPYIKLDAK